MKGNKKNSVTRRKTWLFGIVAILIILTACGSGEKEEQAETDESMPHTEYAYEKKTIRYGEMSGAFSFVKEVEKTQTECAAYYFETAISREEREACIAATDRALSCIDGALPEIEIVVLKPESYEGTAVYGNRLYTSMQQWDSVEYVTGVLLAGYGEWGNYGLAYGYANHLCREAGLDYREADRFLSMSRPELYDLNLLCFDEKFASTEEAETAKNNACCFVNEYLSAHAEEDFLKLLSDSGTAEGVGSVNEVLEAFYKENGVDCSLTNIRYLYGGVSLDYSAACEYAVFYIDKDWQDRNWETNPKVSKNFLHEDYGEVRAFFECNAKQMEQYQELFGLNSYNNALSVNFTNGKSASSPSFYVAGSHTIYLESVVSLMHEYIHSLMEGHYVYQSKWNTEGFARYYDCLHNDYAYDFWNYDYNNLGGVYDSQKVGIYINEYVEHIGRPIDIRTDNRDFGDFMTYVYGWSTPDLTYQSGASFIAYLADTYGEQETIQYVVVGNGYNVEWDKSYEELVQDWNDYINQNYLWYSRE